MPSTLSRWEIPAQSGEQPPKVAQPGGVRVEAQTYVQASPCPQVFPPDKEQSGLRVAPGGAGPGGGAWCLSQAVSWSQEACGQHWTRFSNVTQGPAHVPCREGACCRAHTRACCSHRAPLSDTHSITSRLRAPGDRKAAGLFPPQPRRPCLAPGARPVLNSPSLASWPGAPAPQAEGP